MHEIFRNVEEIQGLKPLQCKKLKAPKSLLVLWKMLTVFPTNRSERKKEERWSVSHAWAFSRFYS